jgi:DNA repair ATPase RecN
MKINIVHQEENMQLFNDAVAALNNAKKLYNEFVQYRNNQFKPLKADADVKAMFAAIEKLIATSYKKMEAIGKKAENYQYDTDGLKESLENLSAKVKTQKAFLQKYLESPEAERLKLL